MGGKTGAFGVPPLAATLLVALLLVAPDSAPRSAPHPAPPLRLVASKAQLTADVIAEVNAARVQHGCRPLRVVDALGVAARRHNRRMARAGYLSHQLPGEARLRPRIRAAGYPARLAGETIGYGARTGRAAARAWFASGPHRALLLDCRYRVAGAGVRDDATGRRWWTVDLARR